LHGHSQATSEQDAGGFGPGRCEGGFELANGRALESDVRVSPPAVAVTVPEPFVVDPETAGPSDAAVHDDGAHVRTVLDDVEAGESEWTERIDLDAGRSERGQFRVGDRPGTERVIEGQHTHASRGALGEYRAKRVRDASGQAVVHLNDDGPLGRPEVRPETRKGLVTVGGDLDAVVRQQNDAGEHGHAERELRLARRHGLIAGPDVSHAAHDAPPRRREKRDEREGQHNNQGCYAEKDRSGAQ